MNPSRQIHFWLARAIIGIALSTAHAAPVDFSRDIQPLLAEHCHRCHGPRKQKAGLRLDNNADAFKPGESGNVPIVPRDPAKSVLLKLVSSSDKDERMPPKGEPLTAAQIALLKTWIEAGADWPASTAQGSGDRQAEFVVTDEDREHWSFLPLKPPPIPSGRNGWAKTPVDQFILAALEGKGLAPSPIAARRTLIRRVYFDLVGLPPTPEEIEAFVNDPGTDAYERLIDRLLASPHYGERWGRHWLDVARYADSDGQENDRDRPSAYHYRDFVIRAFNDDLPYDRFVQWQIAGAEIDPDNPRAIAATGFIVGGPHTVFETITMEEEITRSRFNELDDMLSTTGSAFLALTVACARCHDHKYDPIPTRDYYRMLIAFNSGDRAEVPLGSRAQVQANRKAAQEWKTAHDTARKRLDEWLAAEKKPFTKPLRDSRIDALPIDDASKALLKSEPDSSRAKELLRKHEKALKLSDDDFRKAFSQEQIASWDAMAKELKALETKKPALLPTAHAMADFGAEPRETWLFDRGDFSAKKESIQLGFLSVLTGKRRPHDYLASARAERPLENSTYQRKAMAQWITDLEGGAGALLARVIVNRVWQHHFGEGLVRTVNDFGAQGEAPSHPELLEWLSSEFVHGGWKLKPLHRLILISSTYQQAPEFDPARAKIDPDNRLLWRCRPRRVEAEILRDAILAVSGQLNAQLFGPAVKGPIQAEAIQARNVKDPYPNDLKDTPNTRRRSIYMFHKRVVQSPLMQAFDGPDASASCGRRISTTVAPQALALLNDRFIRTRSADFARRLATEAGDDTNACVQRGYQLALGRAASPTELAASAHFIEAQTKTRTDRDKVSSGDARHAALSDYCQALFNLNEFIYVD